MKSHINRRAFLQRIACTSAAIVAAPALSLCGSKVNKPNIIFILADDLGWADIGAYGQQDIETPHLDQMAAEGIRFTQHYAGNSMCAPSRTSLMTGKHMGHCSTRTNKEGRIRENEPTLGTVLKQTGYVTACIGKWGCGFDLPPTDPNDHGFDLFYGYVQTGHAHNYYPSFLYRNGQKEMLSNVVPNEDTGPYEGKGEATEKNEYAHDLLTSEALKFIENQQEPFFLHLCYNIPHVNNEAQVPLEVPDLWTYEDKPWNYAMKAYASMISRMDHDIGRLLQKLRELAIDQNTLVLFSGDNGPHNKGGYDPSMFNSTAHLRDNKFTDYEGGIREPLIGWWPGHISPGRTTDHISAFWDFLPTVCDVAGTEISDNIDGISYLPVLLGDEEQPQHEYLYWERYLNNNTKARQSVRRGDWKGMRTVELARQDDSTYFPAVELYNLADDPGETTNLVEDHPDIVQQIESMMADAHEPDPNGELPAIPTYITAVEGCDQEVTAKSFKISQNYPNPFNPSTKIDFFVAKPGMIMLTVYDAQGRLIETLVNGNLNAGLHTVTLNAEKCPSGTYIYKLTTEGHTSFKKMTLVK